jgi:hypothetical protein
MLVKARGDLQIVGASRLEDGLAVWLGPGGRWVGHAEEAEVFARDAVAAALEAAQADVAAHRVVDVYPIDVALVEGRPVPLHMRERVKALGPSIRPDLGRQAGRPAPFTL